MKFTRLASSTSNRTSLGQSLPLAIDFAYEGIHLNCFLLYVIFFHSRVLGKIVPVVTDLAAFQRALLGRIKLIVKKLQSYF